MINPIYNLPNLDFVGGESKQLVFDLRRPSGSPFNAYGCTAALSIIDYTNKTGEPLIVETGILSEDDNGFISKLTFEIPTADTINLFGKYVYQLSIKDNFGLLDIPGQGIMNITRNIHQNFVPVADNNS